MPVTHAQQQTGGHRRVRTLDLDELNFTQSCSALNKPRSRPAEHHPTWRSHRLHPLGHTDLLTDGGVPERPGTDLPGDHLTGVQSHPQLQFYTVALSHVDCKPLRLALNAQGRETATHGVVLHRDRRTKHRHDAVTGELVDRAAAPLYSCRAPVGQVGHDLAQPFRPYRRSDVHGVHHIGEQDRDLFVLGRRCAGRNGCTALATKLGLLVQRGAARSARQLRGSHLTRPDPQSITSIWCHHRPDLSALITRLEGPLS
jgi:hypothetical protein